MRDFGLLGVGALSLSALFCLRSAAVGPLIRQYIVAKFALQTVRKRGAFRANSPCVQFFGFIDLPRAIISMLLSSVKIGGVALFCQLYQARRFLIELPFTQSPFTVIRHEVERPAVATLTGEARFPTPFPRPAICSIKAADCQDGQARRDPSRSFGSGFLLLGGAWLFDNL